MVRLTALLVPLSLLLVTRLAQAQDEPLLGGQPPPQQTTPPPPPAQPKPPAAEAAPAGNQTAGASLDSPVVRATGGNIGMWFRFGGLATLTHTGNARTIGTGLVFNQVGLKFVFSEKLMLPVWFGTGLRLDADGGTSTNFGIDMGVGLEYHFRIWRRISPFFGGGFGFDVEKPSGDGNAAFGFGLGPVLGVEYYIADRLSLTAQYMFTIQIAHRSDVGVTTFGFATLAGGAVNITYYF